nr:hypothetical protein GCM10017745_44530 [Saccharothrix mutabilis subsp. capreolus]
MVRAFCGVGLGTGTGDPVTWVVQALSANASPTTAATRPDGLIMRAA